MLSKVEKNATEGHALKRKKTIHIIGLVSFSLLTSACQTTNPAGVYSGVDYRTNKAEEALAETEFSSCEDEALALDSAARASNNTAQYLSSARLLDRCLGELSNFTSAVSTDRQMRAQALSALNYYKGGDVAKAQTQLANMRARFSGQDLYLADSSSVIDTLSLLFGEQPDSAAKSHSLLNASRTVKSEVRRARYWADK